MKRLLLINPWIADVAAFDLWAWPLGLLVWAAHLRRSGFEIALIDCTDRAHPALEGRVPASRACHTGKYPATVWEPQPECARRAERIFRRYGMPPSAFEAELARVAREWDAPPDAILVSSRMTYWYPGVADVIARCRVRWPNAPVALGGIYATLCPDHARAYSGADAVFGTLASPDFSRWLSERIATEAVPPLPADFTVWPRAAFDLCHSRLSLPLMTSHGCPMRCSYCASHLLAPVFARRPADDVFAEIRDSHAAWGTSDFAFYDDALLIESPRYFEPLLERVVLTDLSVRFHMPNGIHYGAVTGSLATIMRAAGVRTVRLSLESTSPERLATWHRSGSEAIFRRAVGMLRDAGFSRSDIGVYIMAGVPGQSPEEVRRTIQAAWDGGAVPRLNEFSPIPGTQEWARAVELSAGEIEREPLWQNNSLYWTRGDAFPAQAMLDLKALVHRMADDAKRER